MTGISSGLLGLTLLNLPLLLVYMYTVRERENTLVMSCKLLVDGGLPDLSIHHSPLPDNLGPYLSVFYQQCLV